MKRRTLWKIHSWLGLVAAAPLLVIAASGSILVFHDEIDGWLRAEEVRVIRPDAPRLDLDTLLASVRSALPDHEIMGLSIHRDPRRADLVYVVRRGTSDWLALRVDAGTGARLSAPRPTDSYLTGWLLELHYTFLAGHIGVALTGVFALLLCALGITGIIVYRRFWLRFLTLRWGATMRQQLANLHKRAGIVSSPVLLILGLTGAYWNITHIVGDLIEHGYDDNPVIVTGRSYGASLSLNALLAEARQSIPGFEVRYVSLPERDDAPIALYGESRPWHPLRSAFGSVVTFDAQTGERTAFSDIREAGFWRQVEDAFVPLHFGAFGGIPVRILWSAFGFVPAFLAISGTTVRARRSRPRAIAVSSAWRWRGCAEQTDRRKRI